MGITFRLSIDGGREMLAAFRRLPKEASKQLRQSSKQISQDEAGRIRAAAVGSPAGQGAAVAPSIRAQSDRVPSVVGGGRRRATKQRRRSRGQDPTTAGDLIFGANFGATHLSQFPPHNGGAGSDDYFFFKTVEKDMPKIVAEWTDAVDRTLRDWASD